MKKKAKNNRLCQISRPTDFSQTCSLWQYLKYSLVLNIYCMRLSSMNQKCTLHSIPVGCQPAPYIFPLAIEFAKGKMCCNL